MAKPYLPPLMALANKRALSRDPDHTDMMLTAAAIWYRWWCALNAPGHLASPSSLKERISDPGAWARAEESQIKNCDLAREATIGRMAANNLAIILDLFVVQESTVEQAAESIFGDTKKLSLEKTRDRLRNALDWVVGHKRLRTRKY